jgi:hypothetical protein
MQSGLIDDCAGEQGDAVLFSRQCQSVESAGPPVVKVGFDANLVQGRVVILLL